MKIKVFQKLLLRLEDGVEHALEVGVHDVEEHIANHWFVRGHSEPVEVPKTEAAEATEPATEPEPRKCDCADREKQVCDVCQKFDPATAVDDIKEVAEKLVDVLSPKKAGRK